MNSDSDSSEEWHQVTCSDSILEIEAHHSKTYNVVPYTQSVHKKRKLKSQKTRQDNKINILKSKIWSMLQLEIFSYIHDQTHQNTLYIAFMMSMLPSSIFPSSLSNLEITKLKGIITWWNLHTYDDQIQIPELDCKDTSIILTLRSCYLIHMIRYIFPRIPFRLVFQISWNIPESFTEFLSPVIQYWHDLQWNSIKSLPEIQDFAFISLFENNYMMDVSISFGISTTPIWMRSILEHFNSKQRDLYNSESLSRIIEIEQAHLDHLLITKIPKPHDAKSFKGHPCFALERYLRYNQVIYPKEPLIGHVQTTGDSIYLTRCVHHVRSKEAWLYLGRSIIKDSIPAKIVMKKPRIKDSEIPKLPRSIMLYGIWQTIPFQPQSIDADGKIPKNSFNNIELFHPNMLPIGAIHIKNSPGIGFVARSLNIEYADAVVGFQFQHDKTVPIIDGIVVDKSLESQVKSAYTKHLQNLKEQSSKEREKSLILHWKRLVKKAMICKRIDIKYKIK